MEHGAYERITYPVTPYKELNKYITDYIIEITNLYHDNREKDTSDYELQITFDYYEYDSYLSFLATVYYTSGDSEEIRYHPFTYNFKMNEFKSLYDIGIKEPGSFYYNGTDIYYLKNCELYVEPYTLTVSEIMIQIKPKIALTFDDGPNQRITPKILDVLDEYNVKATFFMIGEQIPKNQDIVKRILLSGHQIGNHTFTHRNITKLSEEELIEELRKTDEQLATFNYISTVFRPPYGSYSKTVASKIDKTLITWDLDSRDWELLDAQKVYNKVLKEVKENEIILMHDMYESTYEAVKKLIPELLDEGYEFVTVDELLKCRE